jgi:hypothetical protein
MIRRRLEGFELTSALMWIVGGLIVALVIYGSASTLVAGKYDGRVWADLVVYGWPWAASMP